ncbi:spore germination protein [[Clostridium] leptum]|nr:spore germination protein [[Clostridium] leptum]
MNRYKISVSQLFFMLFVSRLVLSLTYLVGSNERVMGSDYLFVVLFQIVINFILVIPVFLMMRQYPGQNVIEASQTAWGKGGTVVAVVYGLFFLIECIQSVGDFGFFASTTMTSNLSSFWFSVLILVAAAYAATLGLEALARTSAILAVIIFLSVIYVIVSVTPAIDPLSMRPFFEAKTSQFAKGIFQSISQNPELVFLLMLIPFAKGKAKKGFAIWNIVTVASILSIDTIGRLVLGNAYYTTTFPFYTTATVTATGMAQRSDALTAAIWAGGAFVKAALMLTLLALALERVFHGKYRKTIIWGGAVLVAVVSPWFSQNLQDLMEAGMYPIESGIVLALCGVIPLALWAVARHRAKGGRKVCESS